MVHNFVHNKMYTVCFRCGESKLQTVFVIPSITRDVFLNISIGTSENVDEQTAQNGYIEPASSQNAGVMRGECK
jgi:hypothetical protein